MMSVYVSLVSVCSVSSGQCSGILETWNAGPELQIQRGNEKFDICVEKQKMCGLLSVRNKFCIKQMKLSCNLDLRFFGGKSL